MRGKDLKGHPWGVCVCVCSVERADGRCGKGRSYCVSLRIVNGVFPLCFADFGEVIICFSVVIFGSKSLIVTGLCLYPNL